MRQHRFLGYDKVLHKINDKPKKKFSQSDEVVEVFKKIVSSNFISATT